MGNCKTKNALFSPAKLNLGLRIVGRRADGYHLLESIFWPLSLGDEVCVGPANRLSVAMEWKETVPLPGRTPLPPEESNLVYRIARDLRLALAIEIHKEIPVGGGLGGGSSNAGTFLRYLKKRGKLTESRARELAIGMGADIPFFLNPVPSLVTGVGETVAPLSLIGENSHLYFLLVLLPIPTSTKDVFDLFSQNAKFSPPGVISGTVLSKSFRLRNYLSQCANDLEESAVETTPLIGNALDALSLLPCLYRGMSGSGSTCFAVFENEAALLESDKALQQFCRQTQCRTVKAETYVA